MCEIDNNVGVAVPGKRVAMDADAARGGEFGTDAVVLQENAVVAGCGGFVLVRKRER